MKIVGLVAEYNPFHHGHAYHIAQAKKQTGADYVVVVMSGDFVQRGTPAILEKHIRAEMALLGGADLVLELPVRYATSSAESFALGSVSLLDALGCVDNVCFGSECGDMASLMELSRILVEEPEYYQADLQKYLKEGLSFPAARAAALSDYAHILRDPNNILGIEYCKALHVICSSMAPITIKRMGNDYHDANLHSPTCSATALRWALQTEHNPREIACHMSPEQYLILEEAVRTKGPLWEDDFSPLLAYQLWSVSPDELGTFLDMTPSLCDRMSNLRNEYKDFSSFAARLKSKDLTRTRVNRALLHILLQIKQQPFRPEALYARILGFKKSSSPLLTEIKRTSRIPLISKLAHVDQLLTTDQLALLNETSRCSSLYEIVSSGKMQRPFISEESRPIVIR